MGIWHDIREIWSRLSLISQGLIWVLIWLGAVGAGIVVLWQLGKWVRGMSTASRDLKEAMARNQNLTAQLEERERALKDAKDELGRTHQQLFEASTQNALLRTTLDITGVGSGALATQSSEVSGGKRGTQEPQEVKLREEDRELLRKAVALAEALRARAPTEPGPDAEFFFLQGNAKYGLGDRSGAMADFTRAIELRPDLAEAYNNRGVAYRHKGEHDQAIADYTKAIELRPDLAEAYNNRGNAYDDKKDYDGAIADCTRAIELRPDLAEAYNNRGVAYGHKGEHDQAIADYTKAIELRPDYANAYYNRACGYSLLKDMQRCMEDLEKAIALDESYRTMAKQDPDLEWARQGPRVRKLLGL